MIFYAHFWNTRNIKFKYGAHLKIANLNNNINYCGRGTGNFLFVIVSTNMKHQFLV